VNKRISTLPNLLSLLRLAMIPLLMWLCLENETPLWTALVLLLSAATDVLDGVIARKYGMESELGKILDPVADKLTLGAMLFCLGVTQRRLRLLLIILVIKELVTAVMSLYAIRKTGQVRGAEWHGKLTTALLYTLIIDRLVPWALPALLALLCAGMMILSMVLYWNRNMDMLRKGKDA